MTCRGLDYREIEAAGPVTYLEHERPALEALLAEKTKKGYRAVSAAAVASAPIPVKALKAVGDADARAQAVLNRLQRPHDKSNWPLNRAIWRAGELKISAAAPLLVNLIGSGDALRCELLPAVYRQPIAQSAAVAGAPIMSSGRYRLSR